MVEEFAGAIREERAPLTDGHAGLRVLDILEAARAASSHQRRRRPAAGRRGERRCSLAGGRGPS